MDDSEYQVDLLVKHPYRALGPKLFLSGNPTVQRPRPQEDAGVLPTISSEEPISSLPHKARQSMCMASISAEKPLVLTQPDLPILRGPLCGTAGDVAAKPWLYALGLYALSSQNC